MTGPAGEPDEMATEAPAPVPALQIVRRGLAVTPGVKTGLAVTALFAVFAGAGRIVVPLSVQLFIDHGVAASSGLNLPAIVWSCALAVAALGLTALSAYGMNVRLVKVTETALATLRTKAFEHVHRLSMLDQQEHRRGALVSRITGDVDQISQFLQWGGLLLLTSVCQVTLATAVMAFYSWQLTLLVLACFVPLIALAPRAQRRLSAAYRTVRERAGGTLSAISESVTGATVVRAYGAAPRTRRRVHSRVRSYADQQVRAQRLSV
ncbi:MAG: ABC transporter transmembrane domain-containing protein, partial [Mycobacteriales bacterium]